MLTYELPVQFTRESWHGRMKACRGIGASGLKESAIQKWEQEHWEYMQSLPEKFDVLHYVTILDLEKIQKVVQKEKFDRMEQQKNTKGLDAKIALILLQNS